MPGPRDEYDLYFDGDDLIAPEETFSLVDLEDAVWYIYDEEGELVDILYPEEGNESGLV